MRWLAWTTLMAVAFGAGAAGLNSEFNPVRTHPQGTAGAAVERLIIKLRSSAGTGAVTAAAATSEEAQIEAARRRVTVVAGRHGLTLKVARPITARMHVVHLESALAAESVATSLDALRADPEVEYAEIDQRRYAHATPNDSLFLTQQWYLQNSATTPAAIDAMTAWDTQKGSSTLVIADLDTGVRFDHPDLLATSAGGRLLPGYCFITDSFTANNSTCPGSDASDPGDWVAQADLSHSECTGGTVQTSSWHGTRTAGLLGAITNNMTGIAGVTWQTQILPVRVLGKCGGFDSDILTAMLWAAGIHVLVNGVAVPDNPNPAKVMNMSFGATSTCPSTYTDMISQVTAKGVLIVVSAGNEGGPVDAPANCPGVAAIAGIRHIGTKVGYSSLGPEIALSAPAGNCVNTAPGSTCLYPITTTFNTGTTTPMTNSYTDQVNTPNLGTSFSAPLVAGIGALMAATNSSLNSCRLISRLKESALPFPQTSTTTTTMCHVPTGSTDIQGSECICTSDGRTCGAGMANAPGALMAAVRPVAAVTVPSTVTAGQGVVLQGGASAAAPGHTIATYQWTSVGAQTLSIQGGATATATVTAPSCGLGTVGLTVTDELNRQDTADVVFSPTSATTTAPTAVSATGACSVTPATIQVAVCPTTDSIQAGASAHTFTATLGNTSNMAVTWQVNGVTGGSAATGTISTSGVYTPPANVPTPATVTISAVSAADLAQSSTAQVTITAPPSSGGGGGGGALDVATLLALALASALLSPYNSRCAASNQGRCARR